MQRMERIEDGARIAPTRSGFVPTLVGFDPSHQLLMRDRDGIENEKILVKAPSNIQRRELGRMLAKL